MRQRDMTNLMGMLDGLTRGQRKMLAAELSVREATCSSIEILEKDAPAQSKCPHCASRQVVKNGTAHGLQRYKCYACRTTFNALTGTPLARLRKKGKWLGQVEAMRDGLTIHQTAERLGVNPKTAFHWRHRFLSLPKAVQAQTLTGIAEADETYFLRSLKGQRKGLTRPARKRGGKAKKRGTSAEQVPVLVARDRAGSTADFILDADDAVHVATVLRPILADDAILCTDGSKVLAAAAKNMNVFHRPVNLSAGVRVVGGVYHVQNVNAYGSRLKNWMRRFKGVATRYLDSYLGWFRILDRSPGFDPKPALLLRMAAGV